MYKCTKCKEPMRSGLNTVGMQCDKCGSKMFYKERLNVKKTCKAV